MAGRGAADPPRRPDRRRARSCLKAHTHAPLRLTHDTGVQPTLPTHGSSADSSLRCRRTATLPTEPYAADARLLGRQRPTLLACLLRSHLVLQQLVSAHAACTSCLRASLQGCHNLRKMIKVKTLKVQIKGTARYQQILHRNLVYLATIADSNQNMQSLLPAVSPNHVSLQPTAQSTLPTTSMSMSGGSHSSGPGYSHAGPASQSVPLQGQGTIGNYVSRTNINMQSNPVSMMHQQAATSHYNSAQGGSQHYQGQSSIAMMGQGGQASGLMGQRPMAPYRASQQGSSQQYLGQEEYYSEQYSHSQGATEPMSQQYYPDGHGDYAYQQSSYTDQSYDRSFEESAQHYYEGGNPQYSQQQAGYQQGTAQPQTYSQQQYPNQQSYPGQQQGYGPAQGAPAQYSSYQQGQGQQYGSYRSSQTGPSAQQQRPYGYEQGQYGNYQQ
ncbi:calcium-responsive transactivator [Orycteropus afer afer]|uniref:Calcium-responsive transactivator n=1 Tax=Orycteropus afer afer TaxID=1230840 RepID=A0A8B7AY99_ORYAF|nr:calcium-responsive transactivator [Orycteropus afer afer]